MELPEYLRFVADKIEQAVNEHNKSEAIRLTTLVIDVCYETLKKIKEQ